MKLRALFFIILLILPIGILPILAQSENYLTLDNGSILKIYDGSQGYDKVLNKNGSILVYSQKYTIEYQQGSNWKQITTPYSVTTDDTKTTRHYTDYLGTTSEVIYRKKNGSIKMDILINSSQTRNYRIVWNLDGITNTDYTINEYSVNFTGPGDWVVFDWSDAFNQYGDITSYQVSDSANGKKLEVIFNIGEIAAGESKILDPTIISSNTGGAVDVTLDLDTLHPSANASLSAISMSFQVPAGPNVTLTSIEWLLLKSGAPSGLSYAKIYAHSGVFGTSSVPTGAALATSDSVNVNTFGVGATYINFAFTGANRITLIAGDYYVITYENPSAGVVTPANRPRVTRYTNNVAGNLATYSNGAWSPNAARDFRYRVYANYDPKSLNMTADTPKPRDQWGYINTTIMDRDGVADFNLITMLFYHHEDNSYNYTITWAQATNTFTKTVDQRSMITLNAGTSANLNASATYLSLNLTQTAGLSGNYDCNITILDDSAAVVNRTYLTVYAFQYFNWIIEVYDLINSGFAQFGIIDYMAQITAAINSISANFVDSLAGIVTLITLQFQVIWAVFSWFTTWATRMITTVLTFGTTFRTILNGGLGGFIDLWTTFSFTSWGPDLLPVFLIVYWIASVSRRAKSQGLFTVLYGDLNAFANVFAFFMGMFTLVVGFIEDKVNYLFSVISI